MKHADYLVDIVDSTGQVMGQKRRGDLDKLDDHYHGVYVMVVTPGGELILSEIPQRRDLPNLYPGRLGVTLATIRRHRESVNAAATRVLAEEFNMPERQPEFIGEDWFTFRDGRGTYISLFREIAEPPLQYRLPDIGGQTTVMAGSFSTLATARPDRMAPTLLALWERWGHEFTR